jgi:hypothetical protein
VTNRNLVPPAIAASVVATAIYGAMSLLDQIRENFEDQGRAETEDYNLITTAYMNLENAANAQGLEQFDPRT